MNGFLTHLLKLIALSAMCALLAACVTTSDARFQNKDKEKALAQYVQLGISYAQKGERVRAKQHLSRALEIDPDSPDVHNAFAYLFQIQGEYELVETHYRKALRHAPDSTRIRNNYAAFLYSQERYEDACTQLERATKDPLYELRPAVFENLGLCRLQLNDQTKALAAFERAVRLDEYRHRAMLEAAWLYYDDNEKEKAGAFFERYQRFVRLRRAPNNPRYLLLGVKLAQESGDRDQEASMRLQLRNLFPDSKENQSL